MPDFALDQNVRALAVAFGTDVGAINDAIVAVNSRVDNLPTTGGGDPATGVDTDYVALYQAAK